MAVVACVIACVIVCANVCNVCNYVGPMCVIIRVIMCEIVGVTNACNYVCNCVRKCM